MEQNKAMSEYKKVSKILQEIGANRVDNSEEFSKSCMGFNVKNTFKGSIGENVSFVGYENIIGFLGKYRREINAQLVEQLNENQFKDLCRIYACGNDENKYSITVNTPLKENAEVTKTYFAGGTKEEDGSLCLEHDVREDAITLINNLCSTIQKSKEKTNSNDKLRKLNIAAKITDLAHINDSKGQEM